MQRGQGARLHKLLTRRNYSSVAVVEGFMADEHHPLRSVELHILLSVVDRPRHGYAILQEAEERTGGRPGFEIPTLYRALLRLREAGLIRAIAPRDPGPDERREYWEATKLGRRTLEAELTRMEVAVAVGRARIGKAAAGGRK